MASPANTRLPHETWKEQAVPHFDFMQAYQCRTKITAGRGRKRWKKWIVAYFDVDLIGQLDLQRSFACLFYGLFIDI
jgi:hypothetical protein